MYEFADQWGKHVHELGTGAYEPNLPITCVSCIHRLDSVMSKWLDTLTARHNLPPNFWKGYKFGWS